MGFGDRDCPHEVVRVAGDSSAAPRSRSDEGWDGFSGAKQDPGQMLSLGQGNCRIRIQIFAFKNGEMASKNGNCKKRIQNGIFLLNIFENTIVSLSLSQGDDAEKTVFTLSPASVSIFHPAQSWRDIALPCTAYLRKPTPRSIRH